VAKRNLPDVTVIIPVYKDWPRLRTCLRALARQDYARDGFEIIVVDNGSPSPLPTELRREFTRIRFEHESKVGSYAARNKGLSLAKGELLAFTDADCIPDPGWLSSGVRHLQNDPECGLVGGRVELVFQKENEPNLYELYESLTDFRQHDNVTGLHFSVTANLFTTRRVVDTVGPFADNAKSFGDFEWGQRVHAAGLRMAYCEEAVVRHPARASFAALATTARRHIGGTSDLKGAQRAGGAQRIATEIVWSLTPPLRSMYRLWSQSHNRPLPMRLGVVGLRLRMKLVQVRELVRIGGGKTTVRE
jgi:cellulose synthase/poly-beta-1,6-N-acetylglucosamine synthase-like glycosyltransferase